MAAATGGSRWTRSTRTASALARLGVIGLNGEEVMEHAQVIKCADEIEGDAPRHRRLRGGDGGDGGSARSPA